VIDTRARERVAVVGVGIVSAGVALALAIGDPNRGGFPRCPFNQVTGLWCPGCGTQRALHAFLHFDIAGAAAMNVLALVALPLLAYAYVAWVSRAFGWRPLGPPRLPLWLTRSAPAIVIGFSIVRNLPPGRFLAP
jgi:hypothetical protein